MNTPDLQLLGHIQRVNNAVGPLVTDMFPTRVGARLDPTKVTELADLYRGVLADMDNYLSNRAAVDGEVIATDQPVLPAGR